jgi:DNA-binding GntR family transcriptional regulator
MVSEPEMVTPELPTVLERLAQQVSSGYPLVGTMVYEALREAVLSGAFQPGQPLRQEALAASIGVSRVPVRSALIQLEADGLIELNDRRGAVVKTHTAAQARELYEIRIVLELHALTLSMQTMTPERVARLRELSAAAEVNRAIQVDARADFYAELFDERNNPELVQLLVQSRLKLGRYLFGWRRKHPHDHAHGALVDAVAAGDQAGALRLVRENLEGVRDGILAMIAEEEAAHKAQPTGAGRQPAAFAGLRTPATTSEHI